MINKRVQTERMQLSADLKSTGAKKLDLFFDCCKNEKQEE